MSTGRVASAMIRNRTCAAYESKSVDCSESGTPVKFVGRRLTGRRYWRQKLHVVVPHTPGNGLVADDHGTAQLVRKLVKFGGRNFIGGGCDDVARAFAVFGYRCSCRYYLVDTFFLLDLG